MHRVTDGCSTREQKAASCCEKALEYAPGAGKERGKVLWRRGQARMGLGDCRSAHADLMQAARCDPQNRELRELLASANHTVTNVFVQCFGELVVLEAFFSSRLGFQVSLKNGKALSDFTPTLGYIFEPWLSAYSHWAWMCEPPLFPATCQPAARATRMK